MTTTIIKHSAMNAVVGLTMLATGFVCSIIVARLLGAEAVGIVAFSMWLVTTAIAIADLGISIALRRFIPEIKQEGHGTVGALRFGAYMLVPFAASVILLTTLHYVIYALGGYASVTFETGEAILLTGGIFVVHAFGAYNASFLVSDQDYGRLTRLTLWAAPLQIIAVTAGALTYGVVGALMGYVATYILSFFDCARIAVQKRSNFGIDLDRIVRYSMLSWVSYGIQMIFLNRAEFLFIGIFASHEGIGFYSAAISLANMALQLPIQASGALIPYYSEQRYTGREETPPDALQGSIRAMALIALPLCFGLAAIAPELMPAAFGEDFRPASDVLVVLALTSPLFVFAAFGSQFLYATERVRSVLASGVVGAAIMVVGCLVAVPAYGPVGAAVVRGATYFCMSAVIFHQIRMARASRSTLRSLLKITIAAVICAFAARLTLVPLHGWAGIGAAVVVGALAYGAAIRLFRALPATDVRVLGAATARLPAFIGQTVRYVGNRPGA